MNRKELRERMKGETGRDRNSESKATRPIGNELEGSLEVEELGTH